MIPVPISTRARGAAAVAVAVVLTIGAHRARGQELAAAPAAAPPPAELADPIGAVLQSGAVRVTAGHGTIDFWWVKSLPLKPLSSSLSWAAVEEGTLVGAVQLSAGWTGVRGAPVAPGLYTLRYARDASSDVLVLSPGTGDETASMLDRDEMLEVNPPEWLIDPPVASSAPLTAFRNAAGREGVVFEVPASREGADVGTIRFGLILPRH